MNWLRLCGYGYLNDISAEVLIQDHHICSIQCRILLFFTEYHMSEAVKHLGQWVVLNVLFA